MGIKAARDRGTGGARLSRHRLAQGEFVDETIEIDGARATVKRAINQTPLDRFQRRGLIDLRQAEAGGRLAKDWFLARLEPRQVASYSDLIDCGTAPDPAVDRFHARKRVAMALQAVGRIAASEVTQVCCLEQAAGGPVGMEILRRGLDVLADHYGL